MSRVTCGLNALQEKHYRQELRTEQHEHVTTKWLRPRTRRTRVSSPHHHRDGLREEVVLGQPRACDTHRDDLDTGVPQGTPQTSSRSIARVTASNSQTETQAVPVLSNFLTDADPGAHPSKRKTNQTDFKFMFPSAAVSAAEILRHGLESFRGSAMILDFSLN
ncbi:hypothetical protein DFH09DRAFT_1271188 [Mycena vulgaris]|nr:hypothetical protein DFH09DRAFT_1271188 [Mycena vulgaris]